MTATQIFLRFLATNCTLKEYIFFRNIIMYNNGNKFFSKRPLYKNTFVEDYLSRNNRALNNFMTRMFILAPNLKRLYYNNPRFYIIKHAWEKEHSGKTYVKSYGTFRLVRCVQWECKKGVGMYVQYYKRLWNKFLKEKVDDSEKKINSPFRKGETYYFKLKHNNG